MKQCTKCKEVKKLTEFNSRNTGKFGVVSWCKNCKKKVLTRYREDNRKKLSEYGRSFKGKVIKLYKGMRDRSIVRKHPQPNFSIRDFKAWLIVNGYQDIYIAWEKSGFDKELAPSPDRLDNSKGYTFDNMRLVTWYINHNRRYK